MSNGYRAPKKIKYPRTFHLPWSEGLSSDDKLIGSLKSFIGQLVVVTEKMDGENTTLYRDTLHARSVDSRHHPSRNWVKGFWSSIRHNIPEGWRVCGENLYAQHSILYRDLPSYFLGFSIWDDTNTCLDWASTVAWFKQIGVTPVPEMYFGTFDENTIKRLWQTESSLYKEGYVLRLASAFDYVSFGLSVAKFVRKGHVQTDAHWMNQAVRCNHIITHRIETEGE